MPGEMSFANDAPAMLTLPNRAGYAPGELMDLWSINPVTGVITGTFNASASTGGPYAVVITADRSPEVC